MINFDYITKENMKDHNPNWPKITDHRYRLLILGGSGSRKKMHYLYTESKYQFLINKCEDAGLKHRNES